ncbi:J domain-containing protein, partial [Thermosulfuriphilus sp.]
MGKNPFEILGITPQMARDLDEESLFDLVKACYRTLQRLCHPDLSQRISAKRRAEMAVALNLAYEELDLYRNPESFRRWREAYIARLKRPSKSRFKEMEAQLANLSQLKEGLTEALWEHLVSLNKIPVSRTSETISLETTGVCLGLIDVAIKYNLRRYSWGQNPNYKEIILSDKGGVFFKAPPRWELTPAKFITLLWTVPRGAIDIAALLERQPTKDHLLGGGRDLDFRPFELLNTLEIQVFKRECLPYLRREIRKDAYLFSVRQPFNGKIYCEGLIVRIINQRASDRKPL